MLPIESHIAYQHFSAAAYHRLRETLMQQAHLFDWMVSETQIAHSDRLAIAHINQVASAHPKSPPNRRSKEIDSIGSEHQADSFLLLGASTWRVLLTAKPAKAVDAPVDSEQSAVEQIYQVGLTFDDRAIAQFAAQLQAAIEPSLVSNRAVVSDLLFASQPPTDQAFASLHNRYAPSEQSTPHQYSSHQYLHQSYAPPANHPLALSEEKIMAQETFILNWAKQMAAAPDGDSQRGIGALQTQTQQSLLLDQVVTQIRHSLDLRDILETTVAQVRAFLSADRLVLYQFNQLAAEDASKVPLDPSADSPSADSPSADSQLLHRSVVSGHVTYEARASDEITSVLHFTEEECFTPSRLQRARFLSGCPIAIDNVDEQYGNVDCLLTFLQKAQVKSKIISPVVVKGELWGLLIAHQCDRYRHWEETEAVFLQHIAEHLAVAIGQSQLYHQLQLQTTSLESCVVKQTQNLHEALIAAETANATKGEFLSAMSHELRTPLTYIIGMSATLLRWSFGDLSDRQRSYLTTINQSGEQLLGIINNILEFAKVESGQRLLSLGEVSLSGLFENAIALYRDFAQKRGVTLSLDFKIRAEQDSFWADSAQLQQIVSNLTENAIKFTPKGGQVILRAWRESQALAFQVEDTGIGIADSQRDALFEKFKQLESPFQRQYSGTGVGLALTKHLVEMHRGSIQVDSQVNQGSTFTVRLPMQPKSAHSQQHNVQTNNISDTFTNTKRIILLEQDEESAAIICNMLTAAGYEVIWLLEADPLVIQLELLQPMMLIANLSLLSHKTSEIKQLQLSITTIETKVLALVEQEAGPLPVAHHDVLTKPIDPKGLLEKVRRLSCVLSS